MKFRTIYSSIDKSEISILENLFRDEGLEYRVIQDSHKDSKERDQVRKGIEVVEKDWSKARRLLDQTGFIRVGDSAVDVRPKRRSGRWVFFALAAVILLIVALVLGWLMNP